MINLNTEPTFLVDDSTLTVIVKEALKDIKLSLISLGVDHEIKMVKRVDGDPYYDKNQEFKPALLHSYSAPELTATILDGNFIQSLDVNRSLINTLLLHSSFGAGNSGGAAKKADGLGYSDSLIAPIKEYSPINYYGQRCDQHVLNGFWRFITIPLFIRLWESKALILPLTSRLSHYLATTDHIKNLYVALCHAIATNEDVKIFIQCFKANVEDIDLRLGSEGLRVTVNSKNLKRDYPAFLRLLLATDWYGKLNLAEFKNTHVIHCHYWEQWEKGKKRAMTPIIKRDLFRRFGGKEEYLPFGRIIQGGNKLIPQYKEELEELRAVVLSDAERILMLVQLDITKDEISAMNSDECWDFWGKFDSGKLLYDEKGNLSPENVSLFSDIEFYKLENWDNYGKSYLQSASRGVQTHFKGGTKLLIKYFLYLDTWFQEHKPNFNFPIDFSNFTRSVFLIRDTEDESLPRTFAEFIREFGSSSACMQFGKFTRWMQSDSPYVLEEKHGQSASIVTKLEFQKKWWEAAEEKPRSKANVGDDKKAFEGDEFSTLKHLMDMLENYFFEVQKFVIKRVKEAQEYAPKAKKLWTETTGPDQDAQYYIKVSETALLELGWESLNLKYKAKGDERFGILPATQKPRPTQLNFISIDLEVSKKYINPEHFDVKYLDIESGDIKETMFDCEIPAITPVRRLYNEDLGVTLMMPMLNVLRAQLISTDLGIRHIHGFSLDANEFDAHVDDRVDVELGVTTLKITTDKVKTKPWLRPVNYSVMEVLYREREFRSAYPSHFVHEFDYNKDLTFQAIFAQPDTGKPPSSKTRNPCWNELLIAFSSFMSKIKVHPVKYLRWCPKDSKKEFSLSPLSVFSENDPAVKAAKKTISNTFTNRDGNNYVVETEYADITLRAIHTPHSTRNSFISSLTDHMELADIAALVGQKSIATTVHYNQVTKGKFKKYLDSHRAAVNSQSNESSNLVKSFNEDRRKTESVFGFTSIDVHQEDIRFSEGRDQKPRPSGLLILRTAENKNIAFTDTHICPFKMNCPDEIVEENRGYRKCGICRAKVAGIDHGPAIARKIELTEVDLLETFLKHKKYKNNTGKNETNFKVLNDQIAEELAGWELTLQGVEHQRQELLRKNKSSETIQYPPNMLDESIQLTRDKTSVDELVLTTIEEAESFPKLAESSNLLHEIARRLKAKILFSLASANPKEMENYLAEVANSDASGETLLQVSSLVKSMVNTNIIDREQLIKLISDERKQYALPVEKKPSFLRIENDVKTEGNRLIESTSKLVLYNE
ncbi:MAG: site-specific integrase [Colwellia sp.]|nr:site-specific integrase [Colwellia sp.]